jgi:hypothetical protein
MVHGSVDGVGLHTSSPDTNVLGAVHSCGDGAWLYVTSSIQLCMYSFGASQASSTNEARTTTAGSHS